MQDALIDLVNHPTPRTALDELKLKFSPVELIGGLATGLTQSNIVPRQIVR